MKLKSKTKILIVCSILSISAVFTLWAFSENYKNRNNAFVRTYVPHLANKVEALKLDFNSYYLAGISQDKIFLGNVTAPLNMMILDTSFQVIKKERISIDQMDLPFRSVHIEVQSPHFYVSDGTVPIIFRGSTRDWKAKTVSQDEAYFSLMQPLSSKSFAIRSQRSATKENVLGAIFTDSLNNLIFNTALFEKQIDGIFDTDGIMLFNNKLNKLIYIYYYRNEYLLMNENLELQQKGRTIDTVGTAQIEVNFVANKPALASKLSINVQAATYGNLLFIKSKRLGRFELENMLDEASIIDVYDLKKNEYQHSFYLYNHEAEEIQTFRIHDNMLVGLTENHLVRYELDPKIFKP